VKTVSKLKTAILYAEAMYNGSEKAGDLKKLYADTTCLANMSADAAEQVTLLNNPLIAADDKIKVLATLAKRLNLCQSMLNTLKILAQNNKLNLLQMICEQFVDLYQQRHNIAQVEVTTAVELKPAQEAKLKNKLQAIFNKEILIDYIIDPQIMGGLIIKNGTNFIDNSIRHKLNALEQLMKGAK
jgi:F-type H+-transporting ATPase subunit delta